MRSTSCPLTSTYAPWHAHPHGHCTHTQMRMCPFINIGDKIQMGLSFDYHPTFLDTEISSHSSGNCWFSWILFCTGAFSAPVYQPRRAPVSELPRHSFRQSNAGLQFGPVSIDGTERLWSSVHILWLSLHDNKHLVEE